VVADLIERMGDLAREFKLDRTASKVSSLQQQLDTETAELRSLEQQLVAIQSKSGKTEPQEFARSLIAGWQERRLLVEKAEARIGSLEAQRAAVFQQLDAELSHLTDLPENFPLLKARREDYLKARQESERLKAMWGPENADVLKAANALAAAEQAMLREAKQLKAGMVPEVYQIDEELRGLRAERQRDAQAAAVVEQQLASMPQFVADYGRLTADIAQKQKSVTTIQESLHQAEVDSLSRGVRWSVLDEPRPPDTAEGPSLKRTLLLGFAIGLLLGGLPVFRGLFLWFMGLSRTLGAPIPPEPARE
jgi:uncharacterized protein involved in exopolysaccharide biosynthesis